MATAKKEIEEIMLEDDNITVQTPEEKPDYTGPYVEVFLPVIEDGGNNGMKVDQYEHVTIANEKKETCYKVLRGERVPVPVPVFMALKERYGKKI